jgi:hypothetical protein
MDAPTHELLKHMVSCTTRMLCPSRYYLCGLCLSWKDVVFSKKNPQSNQRLPGLTAHHHKVDIVVRLDVLLPKQHTGHPFTRVNGHSLAVIFLVIAFWPPRSSSRPPMWAFILPAPPASLRLCLAETVLTVVYVKTQRGPPTRIEARCWSICPERLSGQDPGRL